MHGAPTCDPRLVCPECFARYLPEAPATVDGCADCTARLREKKLKRKAANARYRAENLERIRARDRERWPERRKGAKTEEG